MNQLMQIGEFSRLSGLSVKALRFYADEGILMPASVEASTGYRFYHADQLGVVNQLVNLRATGLSLGDIRSVLVQSATDSIREQLAQQRKVLERDLMLLRYRLLALDILSQAMTQEGAQALSALRVDIEEPRFVLRRSVASEQVTESFEEAERVAADYKARSPLPPFLEWSESDREQCDIGIPVVDTIPAEAGAEFAGSWGINVSVLHHGPYRALPEKSASLRERLQSLGFGADTVTRHVYLRFGADQKGYRLPRRCLAKSENEYLTRLQIPISLPEDVCR